ncbi:MAG: hypothetical protein NTV34_12465, partial [Proteobacteria bacterium]|nr:hypothetical protein [Pseudomonadota bacterium]
MINLSSGSLGLVIQNSLASFTLNTALQERIFLAGTGIVYFTGLSLLALIAAKKLEFGPLKLLTIVLLAHTLGSAIIRNFFHYSYDAPFVGPCFQYADMFGFILACYWGGHAVLRRQVDVLQKIAAGFAAMLVLSMTIYFTVGFPNVSIRTTSQVSLCFVLGLCGLTYFRRKDFVGFFNLEKTWYNDARFYCLIFLAMPILVYLGAPAPPDNNIVQSSDLLGFAVNSSGLLNAHTGFADEVWRIRYPAGIVGALWIPTFMFGTRSIESSFIMWVFSWVLYI